MKNDLSLSPLFDEFVKTLPPYGDPRDAEISALRQQLAECERERVFQANAHKMAQDALLEQGQQLSAVTQERDEQKELKFALYNLVSSLCGEACSKDTSYWYDYAIKTLAKLSADNGEK